MQKTKHFPESEKWQQLLDIRKIQRIWCKDYRRNQQKNQQEVPERNPQEQQNRTRNSKQYTKTALGLTAAAAVFSTVCITNPAFAENIPLVGNVFKQLGNSMGFYGDYSKYAKQLTDSAEDAELVDTDESQEDGGNPQSAQAEDQNTTEITMQIKRKTMNHTVKQ